MFQPVSFGLGGGLDLITPAVSIPPGRAIASLNYEPVSSGCRRFRGFERFDGQTAPSEAICYQVTYDDNGLGGNVLQVTSGSIIRNAAAALLGYAVSTATLVSGAWGTPTAVGRFYVWIRPAGLALWSDNISIRIGVTTQGFTSGLPVEKADQQGLAATQARTFIAAVPGSGPVRGVWFYGDDVIAMRDDAGATEGVMHRVSGGWVPVTVLERLEFTSGSHEILNVSAAIIVGATSGATGVVRNLVLQSGAWGDGDAAGFLMISDVTGVFGAENIDVLVGADTGTDLFTVAGPSAVENLPIGGRYKFINHNFYGGPDNERMYGANGVGYAFEYNGADQTLAVAVVTGTPTALDTPVTIAAHQNALFLGYEGGSVQFSVVGQPLVYDALLGAGTFEVGDEISDFHPANQGTLAILGQNTIGVLYGHDASDYQFEVLTQEAGALPHTVQKLGQVIYMDNRGLRSLSASQAYGNFRMGSLSQLVAPLLADKRRDGVDPIVSWVCRTEDQYWLVFDDGTGIVVYMGGKQPAILPFDLDFTPTCACSVEVNGVERIFLGASDGFVYEFNKGRSFDGDVIEHYIALPYNHFGSPEADKRILKTIVDIEASGTTTITVAARLDNGSVDGINAQTLSLTTGGAAIDDLGTNELYYQSQIETKGEVYLDCVASNVSLKIGGSTSTEEPHTLTGVTFLVSPRRLKR